MRRAICLGMWKNKSAHDRAAALPAEEMIRDGASYSAKFRLIPWGPSSR